MRPAACPGLAGELRVILSPPRVRVEVPGAPAVSAELALPWTPLHAGLRCLAAHQEPDELARCLGAALAEALLPPAALGALAARWRDAQERDARLRLCLMYDDAESAALPFEALYSALVGGWLARSERISLVRQRLSTPRRLHRTWDQLRVLLLAPQPADLLPLDHQAERRAILAALGPAIDAGRAEVRLLEGAEASRDGLSRALREGRYHTLHIVSHGRWCEAAGEAQVALQEGERAIWVGERDLEGLLGERSPRLVVLNACDSGLVGPRPAPVGRDESAQDWRRAQRSTGLPEAALRAGALSVVAMQGPIQDPHAVAFARWFYEELADGAPAEVAVARARHRLYTVLSQEKDRFRMLSLPALHVAGTDGDRFHLRDGEPS